MWEDERPCRWPVRFRMLEITSSEVSTGIHLLTEIVRNRRGLGQGPGRCKRPKKIDYAQPRCLQTRLRLLGEVRAMPTSWKPPPPWEWRQVVLSTLSTIRSPLTRGAAR